jgi:hypothetical protein
VERLSFDYNQGRYETYLSASQFNLAFPAGLIWQHILGVTMSRWREADANSIEKQVWPRIAQRTNFSLIAPEREMSESEG